jgi:hypothetical protein
MRAIFYILYVWLPAFAAVFSVVGSALISWRHRGVVHGCLSLIASLLVVGALITLYRIFYLDEHQAAVIVVFGREHLNYMPHFAIFGAFIIFATQGFYVLSLKTDAA